MITIGFLSTHHRQPTLPEADQLLSQLQAIPGCETFTVERLIIWFKQKHSFFSLTAETIQHLTVLTENHSDPSDDLIKTWAILLKANVDDIKAWLQCQKEQKESVEPVQVPTPTQSTSPEPNMKRGTPPSPGPLVKHEQSECKVMEIEVTKVLLDAVTSATQEDKAVPPHRSPKSVSEFECMFAPYEEKMSRILNSLLQQHSG
ncbi:hypothetical protein M378DRAFT_168076 [Amanita muscaria Koide BX008]|uniref:Uncharacterized protein n=1 Tax=Amanita muscaria (strain Koide BX008) TaxID=946122 RepID=A0A0C2WVW4_AMAMK|nr:hypothetical protein M378DRAFT_168076 [Amanita muscaria Koide BX008]